MVQGKRREGTQAHLNTYLTIKYILLLEEYIYRPSLGKKDTDRKARDEQGSIPSEQPGG